MSRKQFGKALKKIRALKGFSQEDFTNRSYISGLERELSSPTVEMVEDLCKTMDIHPLTLFTLMYQSKSVTKRVEKELDELK